jgi:rubrerythrin
MVARCADAKEKALWLIAGGFFLGRVSSTKMERMLQGSGFPAPAGREGGRGSTGGRPIPEDDSARRNSVETPVTRGTERNAPSAAEVVEGLNDLLKLDHDAIASYDAAIEKLENREYANQIAGFQQDHERHITDLNELSTSLGGTPDNTRHATAPFKEALQSLGAMAGDTGLLVAWRANELQVRSKYDSYASRAGSWQADVKRVIDQNALDEERHYAWVVNVLQGMGIAPDDDLETGIATRLREARTQAESLAHRAQERIEDAAHRAKDRVEDTVEHAAGAARNRIAASLHSAADRVEDFERSRNLSGRAEAVADQVAGGMHTSADYVSHADLRRIRSDLERSARHHPFRTLAALFAVGFVVGRVLR